MRGHEEIERILASYRDASVEERARADAHVAGCPACAARLTAFAAVDAQLGALARPPLPARLTQPLNTFVDVREHPAAPRRAGGFVFVRALVPAAVVLLVLVALSVLMMSLNSGHTPVTLTPTLTTTLTPTLVSARVTAPAALARFVPVEGGPHRTAVAEPTPAPAPSPAAGRPRTLLAGYGAHATMIH